MQVPDHIHISPKERRSLTIAVVIALFLGYLLLRGFLSMIIVAVIVAFVFTPVYNRLLVRTKSTGRAAALTLLITILAIGIPVTIVLLITVAQAKTMINDISDAVTQNDINASAHDFLNWLNNFLTNLTNQPVNITYEQLQTQLAKYATSFASYVLDLVSGWVGSIGSIITNAILYMYVFTAVLVHQKKIISMVERLNPLGKDVSQLYLQRAGSMTKAMIKGQFIVAAAQGAESALVLSLVGVPYGAFFLLLLTFLSIIPLGAGIVTIPLGIGMILFGDFWGGAIILLNHFLIVTNIDNVLKPKLVPRSVRLQPALLLLAVFGGIALFGFLGIVIGPVLMILVTTTLDIYLHTSTDKLPAAEPEEPPKSGFLSRLFNRG